MKPNQNSEKKYPVYQDGKIFFSRSAERKFFLALTIIMLVAGILAKAGLF